LSHAISNVKKEVEFIASKKMEEEKYKKVGNDLRPEERD
jgi:hypothetical protein